MHFRHRHTDRQTDWHHGISARCRLYITSRAKNWPTLAIFTNFLCILTVSVAQTSLLTALQYVKYFRFCVYAIIFYRPTLIEFNAFVLQEFTSRN